MDKVKEVLLKLERSILKESERHDVKRVLESLQLTINQAQLANLDNLVNILQKQYDILKPQVDSMFAQAKTNRKPTTPYSRGRTDVYEPWAYEREKDIDKPGLPKGTKDY